MVRRPSERHGELNFSGRRMLAIWRLILYSANTSAFVVGDASYCCCGFRRAAIVFERMITDKTEWV